MKAGSNCAMLGSPPHVRGKVIVDLVLTERHRITPACAGKRRTPKQCVFNSRDHPRMCGEKISFFFTGCSPRGSPPRMRGKENRVLRRVLRVGITPACAGKSTLERAIAHNVWDHPRTCGEKRLNGFKKTSGQGSPPHMRGKALARAAMLGNKGITPAHAGKSIPRCQRYPAAGDHPRTCGEKSQLPLFG